MPPESRRLSLVLLAATVATGVVDAVSYLALGRVFTANMTGNIVLIGFALSGAPGLSAIGGGLALLAFVLGAVIGGRMVLPATRVLVYRWIGGAFAAEAALVGAAAVVAGTRVLPLTNRAGLYTEIVLLGLAMGIRAAAIRKLAIPDLVTIALTQTTAALAAESSLAGGHNPRWRWRAGSICAMVGGAMAGAWLLKRSVALPLTLCSVVAGACALVVYREDAPEGADSSTVS